MSTPTAPRIPTPADLARRPAPRPPAAAPKPPAPPRAPMPDQPYEPRQLGPEEALMPGHLSKAEHFRKFYRLGMTVSRMHPNARLVGHDLLWRASHATGRISPNLQPAPQQIAHATGLTTGQVLVSLEVLRSRGWLYEEPIQSGPRAGRMAMRLAIPAHALEEIRALKNRRTAASQTDPPHGGPAR